ncbi:MAG TPA: hypothetical protein VMT35_18615 [Ignavibacteriaceae bacterium]|nr:hypothetical protein [Ignavibacteriaceae bacterium]
MSILDVFLLILIASASALCIALIFYAKKMANSIHNAEVDLKEVSIQIKPLIASATNLSEKLNHLSQEVGSQLEVTREIVNDVKSRVETILDLEQKLRRGFEEPVLDVVKNFSAVINGVKAFWNTYRKN